MDEKFNNLPLRNGVGIVVLNNENKVFVAKRIDNPKNFWQMPQGGIDDGELPIEAGFRELKEETSIVNVEFVCEYPEWISYDIPLPLANNLWNGKYRGQEQRWLLFHFLGEDEEININTSNPEFKNWVWLNPEKLPYKAISFKKSVYIKINKIFIPVLNNFNSSKVC